MRVGNIINKITEIIPSSKLTLIDRGIFPFYTPHKNSDIRIGSTIPYRHESTYLSWHKKGELFANIERMIDKPRGLLPRVARLELDVPSTEYLMQNFPRSIRNFDELTQGTFEREDAPIRPLRNSRRTSGFMPTVTRATFRHFRVTNPDTGAQTEIAISVLNSWIPFWFFSEINDCEELKGFQMDCGIISSLRHWGGDRAEVKITKLNTVIN